jgi:hypothetical protein
MAETGEGRGEMAETDEQDYPGVNAAYELVVPSYTWLVSRFEAADDRLTAS